MYYPQDFETNTTRIGSFRRLAVFARILLGFFWWKNETGPKTDPKLPAAIPGFLWWED